MLFMTGCLGIPKRSTFKDFLDRRQSCRGKFEKEKIKFDKTPGLKSLREELLSRVATQKGEWNNLMTIYLQSAWFILPKK